MKTIDILRLSGLPESTLHKWRKTKPKLFEIIQLGCEAKQQQEQCKTNSKNTLTT